ncbi:hypothetical protein [Corynebacterium ulceribovis]|uniref:hypothetical protein n=1 Tax=Corynebacterium ulceribovis TaxID=487732 RepID=UPI0003650F34|nr:hypothetical protein [Corynebacterium ulceribovis]
MSAVLLIFGAVAIAVVVISQINKSSTSKAVEAKNQMEFHDAAADARRWIERLGGQVLNLTGSDAASSQAIADASERFTAANSQITSATTTAQAKMARESALEGMHYINAAREIMDLPAGPELPPLEGQRIAGKVTETRTIEHEGQEITASPYATSTATHYYPGGRVAGRPVPAGWYSTPWWADALATGMWSAASFMMFSAMFSGMAGVGYSADQFADGYGEGYQDGLDAAGGDAGDAAGDAGGDMGDAGAGGDMGDAGGMDGGDGGGFFDFGGDGGFDFGGFDF